MDDLAQNLYLSPGAVASSPLIHSVSLEQLQCTPITEELYFVNQNFVILQIYENVRKELENVSDLDPLSELFLTLSNRL